MIFDRLSKETPLESIAIRANIEFGPHDDEVVPKLQKNVRNTEYLRRTDW